MLVTAEDEVRMKRELVVAADFASGDRVVHERGSEGIIVATPAGSSYWYRVHTPGGGGYSRRHPGANATWEAGSFRLADPAQH